MDKKLIQIKGDRILLKSLKKENATEEYCSWLNDPFVNKSLVTKGITIPELQQYIKVKNSSANCLFSGIFLKGSQKHIGTIKLEPIDFAKSKATLGILIGDKNYWGKGLGKESINLILNYAFKNLNLKEVNLGVSVENKRAINLFEKTGFKTDRIEKNLLDADGKLFNRIIMSVKNK